MIIDWSFVVLIFLALTIAIVLALIISIMVYFNRKIRIERALLGKFDRLIEVLNKKFEQ